MDSIIGAVIGIVLMFFTATTGFAMSVAYGARTQLAEITTEAAREMAADGGFTLQVQQDLISGLRRNRFDPRKAEVIVRPTAWDPYGQTFSIEIRYPVPVTVVSVTPFDVVVQAEQNGVSLYPCTQQNCDQVPVVMSPPGQGTGDLQGNPKGGTGSWAP